MTELPEGWHLKTIGDLCGQVEKIDPANLDRDTFMYLDIGALEPSSSSLENVEPISTANAPSRARQLIREGDSVFSTVRPYMKKVAYIPREFDGEIASTGFCVLRPKVEKLNPKYLFYFLLSDQLLDQVLPLQRGVSYPAIRDNDLKSALLPLPPLLEQQKIIEILEDHLSRLDAALADVKQATLKAAQFRRSLLQAAFTGNLTGDGTGLMTSWKRVSLSTILQPRKTKDIPAKFPDLPYIGMEHVARDLGTIDFLGRSAEFRSSSPKVFKGDVLYGRLRPYLNKVVIAPSEAFASGEFIVLPANDAITNKFLQYRLLSQDFVEFAGTLDTGDRPRVSWEQISKFQIDLPSLPKQQKIVEILEDHLSRLDASVAIADAMEKQSASLRRSLLQAAFTGQLTKEVASV